MDFPLTSLDPTNYLAAVPAATLARHKELVAAWAGAGKLRPSLRPAPIQTIQEGSEPSSIVTTEPDTVDVAEVELCVTEDTDTEDPNDSGIESNGSHPSGLHHGDVFESGDQEEAVKVDLRKHDGRPRTRQISTSLVKDPVMDDNLKDFHQHHLDPGRDPLDVKYKMYAMVCHSGVLGGGHYVSYSRGGAEEDKWYCHNDSACKEVPELNIDKSSAYILMYEREGLSLKGN